MEPALLMRSHERDGGASGAPRKRRSHDETADFSAILSQQLWLAKLLAEDAVKDAADDVSVASVSTRHDDETSRLTRELMNNLDALWSTVRAAQRPHLHDSLVTSETCSPAHRMHVAAVEIACSGRRRGHVDRACRAHAAPSRRRRAHRPAARHGRWTGAGGGAGGRRARDPRRQHGRRRSGLGGARRSRRAHRDPGAAALARRAAPRRRHVCHDRCVQRAHAQVLPVSKPQRCHGLLLPLRLTVRPRAPLEAARTRRSQPVAPRRVAAPPRERRR